MYKTLLKLCLMVLLVSTIDFADVIPSQLIESDSGTAQVSMTPEKALQLLQEGNARFVSGNSVVQNYFQQIKETAHHQNPFAFVLSCSDSRIPVNAIFNQGIGDIISSRVVGPIDNNEIIGSIEEATKILGAKVVVVMGHTNCEAMQAACLDLKYQHVTDIFQKIQPAVKAIKNSKSKLDCTNPQTIDEIAQQNVQLLIQDILKKSSVVRDLVAKKQLIMIGAMYDVANGRVTFFDGK